MKSKIIRFLLIGVITANLINCAKKGIPTGGDKDIDPPVVLSTVPENLSINFNKKKN